MSKVPLKLFAHFKFAAHDLRLVASSPFSARCYAFQQRDRIAPHWPNMDTQ
jgi:hypothetical protein